MNSSRSRYSLSLVRRSESPKSPISDRTRSSISELEIATRSGCSTPLDKHKSSNPIKGDNDQSPIPMSQDASNVVTGVSWAWNSPTRAVLPNHRLRSKPLTESVVISNKNPDIPRSNRKKMTRKLTGFHRFQSELKLLQERDKSLELQKNNSTSSLQVVPPTSPQPFSDKDNVCVMRTNALSAKKICFNPNPTSVASDSFNDSELDSLLLQASQAVEKQSNISTALLTLPETPLRTTTTNRRSEKQRSFFRSKTSDNFDGSSDDSLAGTELESLLLQLNSETGISSKNTGITQKVASESRNSKSKSLLPRHKSMPESPSRKVYEVSSRSSNIKFAKDTSSQSPVSVSSTSSGSITFVPEKSEVVLVSSTSSSSTTSKSSSPKPVCSKEEIEQKRQEALKRQACRLKRLMRGNHSQDKGKFFKSM